MAKSHKMLLQQASSAWALLAVSDTSQVETLPHQEKWARETAEHNGWTLRDEHIFGRGKAASGRDGVRKTTQQILASLQAMPRAQRPARLLLIRIDRLGRGDSLDVMGALAEFRKLGVLLHTREDGDVAIERTVHTFAPMLRSISAAFENEARVDKAQATFRRKREMKAQDPLVYVGQRPPYGLRLGPTFSRDGHLEADGDAADAVRLAYRLRGEGQSCGAIAKELLRVAPPITRKSGKVVSYRWDGPLVARMLRKATYKGVIVDDDTWHAAQRPDEQRVFAKRRWEWPLTSAVRCECGTPLMGLLGYKAKLRYYACRDRKGVHGKFICYSQEALEVQFVALLRKLRAEPKLIAEYTSAADTLSDRKLLTRRAKELQLEIGEFGARRATLFAALERGVIEDADFKWRNTNLRDDEIGKRDEANTIEAQLAGMAARQRVADNAVDLVRTAARTWPKAATDDRKFIARGIRDAFGGLYVTTLGELKVGQPRALLAAVSD